MSEMTERERFLAVMEGEKLNAREFAREIGISPAAVSQIVSGRNNPSLDVMKKTCNRFRMINTDWLFLGVGSMYRQKADAQQQLLLDIRPEEPAAEASPVCAPEPQTQMHRTAPNTITVERVVEKKVTRVMVFFDDGTFQELNNY